MSTARGGEPRSGAQRLGEPGSFDPALAHLITALTANAHPHELTGRDATLAAFRKAGRPSPRKARLSGLSAWLRRPAGPRRPARILLPARLAVAAASVVAVVGGLTAAAAAQALPAPVQQIAYNVLAPLGVPVSQPKPAPPQHPHSAAPQGRPSPSAAASMAGSQSSPASGPSASPSASATASKRPPAAKPPVTRPTLRLVAGKLTDRLVVVAPSDKAGDTVNLTELAGGVWTTVRSKPLGPKHRAVFYLPASKAAGHLFQAEFPQAKRKLAKASDRLWIPRLPRTGAKGIKPSPNPTTTASTTPDATTTPVASPSPSPSATTLPPSPTASPTPTVTPSPTGSGTTPTPSGTPSPRTTPTPSGTTPSPSPTGSATSDAAQPFPHLI